MMLSLSLHDGKPGLGQLDGDISQEDSFPEMAQKVLNTNVNALKETFSLLNEDNFDKVIRYLHNAERICFYGVGASMLTAMKAANKFLRIEPEPQRIRSRWRNWPGVQARR